MIRYQYFDDIQTSRPHILNINILYPYDIKLLERQTIFNIKSIVTFIIVCLSKQNRVIKIEPNVFNIYFNEKNKCCVGIIGIQYIYIVI